MKHTSAFERFSSPNALYDSSYRVCRNVRWKDSTIMFEENRIEIILDTEEKLKNELYRQLVFSCFSIIERGKPRNIRACHINDRLVQNALCERVLLPELTPKFIYDNCATLQGKGIDFALKRFKYHFQSALRDYGNESDFFGFKIDISKYFDSIDHKSLTNVIKHLIKEEDVCKLLYYVVNTFAFKPTKDKKYNPNKTYYITKNGEYVKFRGTKFSKHHKYYDYEEKSLGLGSQTSQLLALLTLNEIDHFVKEKLHIKYYGRYMDDIYLFHNDKNYLLECKQKIIAELARIGLKLNENKTAIIKIHPIGADKVRKQPFKYLKWNFYITTTGHIIQLPFKKKLSHQRRKLRKMYKRWLDGKITTEDVQTSYAGWRAHMKKGNTFHIIQKMDNYFSSLFKGVEIR